MYKSTDGEEYSEITRGDGLYELELTTGLTPSTQYWFEVRGLNEDGAWGAFSGSQTATTPAVLPPIPTCSAAVDNYDPTVVHVEWSIPSDYQGSVYYYVFSSSDLENWTLVDEGPDFYSTDDTGLSVVPYYYRV